jgi:hypothetical protein
MKLTSSSEEGEVTISKIKFRVTRREYKAIRGTPASVCLHFNSSGDVKTKDILGIITKATEIANNELEKAVLAEIAYYPSYFRLTFEAK